MTFPKIMQQLVKSSVIELIMAVFMTGPLEAFTANSSSSDLREASFDRLPLDDVLFTEDVLQEVSARSRIDCSKKCVETEGCVMCTFHSSPEGPPGLCRLHSQLQKGTDVQQGKTGARSMARRGCDGGYLWACGRCLKGVRELVNCSTAGERCSETQGQVVMPKSSEEARCVWTFAKEQGLRRFWVGADDAEKPGVFRWRDGSQLPHSSPLWADRQPGKVKPEGKCVRIVSSTGPGLRDSVRNKTNHYVCQREAL